MHETILFVKFLIEKPCWLLWYSTEMNAKDDIEIGGWMSSYTREKFTMNEINDFINNTKDKLLPYP